MRPIVWAEAALPIVDSIFESGHIFGGYCRKGFKVIGFFSTLTLGLVAALVGAYLQHTMWRQRTKEEIRQREFREATDLVEDLGKAIDKRLVEQEKFANAVLNETCDNEIYKNYLNALDEWMYNFSSFKTKIYLYFGKDKAAEFEDQVHHRLWYTSQISLRSHRLGYSKLNERDKAEHREVKQMISAARYNSILFINQLNAMIQNYEFGTIQYFNNIEFSKLDYISRTYLIHRLLGMKS